MVIKKTKISTITPVVAIIAAIASMVSIGGGIGIGQQQTALAQVLDSRDIGGDEADLGDIEDAVRDSLEEDEDDEDDEDDGRQRLCPGQIFVPLPGSYTCIAALDDLDDLSDIIANVVSDNDDDPDPEEELCSRPGELFIPRELGGPKCIDTNFTMNPLPDFP